MVGVDMHGMRVVKGDRPGQYDKFSPGIDELTGLGIDAERDGAIIALSLKCGWASDRLARVFKLSERRIQQIIAAFQADFGESH